MTSPTKNLLSASAWALACAFGLVACWDVASLNVAEQELTGGEAGVDASPPLPDAGPLCAAPRVTCGPACVDTANDVAHCGACGAACPPPPPPACEGANVATFGMPACVAGQCVVARSLTDCGASNKQCVAATCSSCAPGFQDKDSNGTCTADCVTAALACSGNGVCSDVTGTAACVCNPGFSGVACATNINDCLGAPCLNGGACADIVGGYMCTCLPGYMGANCETNINDCSPNPCVNGACVDGVNTFTCNCLPGFNGPTCANDIDECAPAPCLNGGTCTDGINSFTCACAPGWTGPTCGININDCAPNPCLNGGMCMDGVDSYTCACVGGFTGANCEMPPAPPPTFLWLDATAAASVTKDGVNNVSQWADLSGLGRHANAGANTKPVWTPGVTPNGLPAILFSGNTVRLQTAPALTSAEMTIFVVFNMVTPFTWGSIINQAHDTYFSIRKSDCCGGNGNLNFHIQNNNAAPLLPITTNTWRVLTAMRQGTTSTMYYDQALPQSHVGDTLTGGANVAITIGNAMAVAESMGGYIAEIRAYNTPLNVAQRTAVETALRAKFGL